MSAFCALCASERGPFVRRPLGKNDALVSICTACDIEPAREVYGPERGYEPTGGLFGQGQVEKALRRTMGDAEYERVSRLEEQLTRAPSGENRHAGDADFATLRYEQERVQRVVRRGRR